MTKIGIAGDWHGSFDWTRHALHTFGQIGGVRKVFHAGDFGLGWPGGWPDLINICESVCKRYGIERYVTPGNHENWDWIDSREYDDGVCQMTPHTFLLERGARMDLYYETSRGHAAVRSLVSLGGAPSIDFPMRIPRMSWWPNEMIRQEHLDRLGQDGYADIMICHDAPNNSTDAMNAIRAIPIHKSIFPSNGVRYAREGAMIMDRAVDIVRPEVFVHGHFHVADEKSVGDTKYVALACNNMRRNLALLDLETYDVEWLDIISEIPSKKK